MKRISFEEWQKRLQNTMPNIILLEQNANKNKVVDFTLKCNDCGSVFKNDRKSLETAYKTRHTNQESRKSFQKYSFPSLVHLPQLIKILSSIL